MWADLENRIRDRPVDEVEGGNLVRNFHRITLKRRKNTKHRTEKQSREAIEVVSRPVGKSCINPISSTTELAGTSSSTKGVLNMNTYKEQRTRSQDGSCVIICSNWLEV